MSDFTDAVEGFDFGDAVSRKWNDDAQRRISAGCAGKQHQRHRDSAGCGSASPLPGASCHSCKQTCAGPVKMTLPSATQFPAISFKYGVTDAVYADPYALLSAVTDIMAEDMRTLSSSGISYLQIDAPRYSYYLDREVDCLDGKRAARRSRRRCLRHH